MEPRFAIATFRRVFEVTPNRDTLTLDELGRGLTRFAVKAKLDRAVERDIEKIERAWDAFQRGERLGGRRWSFIVRSEKREPGGGRAAYHRLMSRAKGHAKTDLRLWSPALYPADSRRESDNVVSLSCLVLDYDGGESIERASEHWTGHHHIVHSTWSHQPGAPKFRLCLPLARPVRAEHWRDFWTWAAERAGMKPDPALKSPGSTFALPATPSSDSPRVAFIQEGRLFDPVLDGNAPEAADPPPEIPHPPVSHFRGGDPDVQYIEEASGPSYDPRDDDFDLFGEGEARNDEPDWDLF